MKRYTKLLVLFLATGAIFQAIASFADQSGGGNDPADKLKQCDALQTKVKAFIESKEFEERVEILSVDDDLKSELHDLVKDLKDIIYASEVEPGP